MQMLGSEKEIDFKILFEFSPCLVIVVSPQLIILSASNDFLSAINDARENIIGNNIIDVFANFQKDTNQEHLSDFYTLYHFVLQNKTAHRLVNQKQVSIDRKVF